MWLFIFCFIFAQSGFAAAYHDYTDGNARKIVYYGNKSTQGLVGCISDIINTANNEKCYPVLIAGVNAFLTEDYQIQNGMDYSYSITTELYNQIVCPELKEKYNLIIFDVFSGKNGDIASQINEELKLLFVNEKDKYDLIFIDTKGCNFSEIFTKWPYENIYQCHFFSHN